MSAAGGAAAIRKRPKPSGSVEPDGEPDERQGQRGEGEVQAEQDQPGAQLDRALAPGQRSDREQRLQAEGRHGKRAGGARR